MRAKLRKSTRTQADRSVATTKRAFRTRGLLPKKASAFFTGLHKTEPKKEWVHLAVPMDILPDTKALLKRYCKDRGFNSKRLIRKMISEYLQEDIEKGDVRKLKVSHVTETVTLEYLGSDSNDIILGGSPPEELMEESIMQYIENEMDRDTIDKRASEERVKELGVKNH